MNKKHYDLLELLYKEERERTSKDISEILSCSIRSVKNYIEQINQQYPNLIISSKNGYRIMNKSEAYKIISEIIKDIPQNSEERIDYILKLFLVEHLKEINIYDLSEEIYVSTSTIKQDINKIKHIYKSFDIKLELKKDVLVLNSTEKGLRRLFRHLILSENTNYVSKNTLRQIFPNYDVDLLMYTITDIFQQQGIFINDFAKNNILIHLLILLDCSKQQNIQIDTIKMKLNDKEEEIVHKLCDKIEDNINQVINDNLRNEIAFIIASNINNVFFKEKADFHDYIESDCIELANYLIEKVAKIYSINLKNPQFLTQFSMHLRNLLIRCKDGTYLNNPMKANIRKQNPYIYDIAVNISILIKDRLGIQIPDDEVCFISLHIGGEIEKMRNNIPKISCVLFTPNYLEIKKWLYTTIADNFSSQINILAITSDETDLLSYDFDICISTVNIEKRRDFDLIVVTPFKDLSYQKRIFYDSFDKIECKNRKQIIRKQVNRYFNEQLFLLEQCGVRYKNDYLKIMCSKMKENGYVHESFYERVLKREEAASTAFNRVAIPHSIEMDGIKTSICVCISKDGILWDNRVVNVVFLLSVNPMENESFNELYEALITLFDEDEVIEMIKNCKTFQQFKTILHSIIN